MAKTFEEKHENSEPKKTKNDFKELLQCGIVMPISAIDGCTAEHWAEVRAIIEEAISDTGLFEPNLVSDTDDAGIIQKTIVQNLYHNPIVVCDVSGKNPNVMFELGLRLAFDKPTIVIKDDFTTYSFDTSPIKHIAYPRDLRFGRIIKFKSELKANILGTYKKVQADPAYSTFLKSFGEFTVVKISEKEVSPENYLVAAIDELRADVKSIIKVNRQHPKDAVFIESNMISTLGQAIEEAYRGVMKEMPEYIKATYDASKWSLIHSQILDKLRKRGITGLHISKLVEDRLLEEGYPVF